MSRETARDLRIRRGMIPRMAVHVAILFKNYIELILRGEKTVESRLTITPRTPFERIRAGERIYFKASSGPFMATAIADAVEFHRNLTPAAVEALRKRWNAEVRGDAAYWQWKRNSRYATFIRLRDVRPTDTGPHLAPSRGLAWFTLADGAAPVPAPPPTCDATLTVGALRNGYVGAPPELVAASRIEGGLGLVLPDGRTVRTDITRGRRLRWRGWSKYFRAEGLEAGDIVRFAPLALGKFSAAFHKAAPSDGRSDEPSIKMKNLPAADAALDLHDFITRRRLTTLIREARSEDLGPAKIDITSELLIPAAARTHAIFRARRSGRLSGAALLPSIVAAYDPALKLRPVLNDGAVLAPGSAVAEVSGSLRSVLAMERVALNFLTLLSGIASLTARFVEAAAGTRARIYDTRKTHPGLRELEKYAVVCGGGHVYRMGLYDAVLVKDNHIAHLSLADLPAALARMIEKARARRPRPAFVMVEVDTLAQLERVLPVSPDIVLLDNMDAAHVRRAVVLRDRLAPGVELEISGGVTLETVRAFALAGVDRISIGALTHSAPALDLGLDIE